MRTSSTRASDRISGSPPTCARRMDAQYASKSPSMNHSTSSRLRSRSSTAAARSRSGLARLSAGAGRAPPSRSATATATERNRAPPVAGDGVDLERAARLRAPSRAVAAFGEHARRARGGGRDGHCLLAVADGAADASRAGLARRRGSTRTPRARARGGRTPRAPSRHESDDGCRSSSYCTGTLIGKVCETIFSDWETLASWRRLKKPKGACVVRSPWPLPRTLPRAAAQPVSIPVVPSGRTSVALHATHRAARSVPFGPRS